MAKTTGSDNGNVLLSLLQQALNPQMDAQLEEDAKKLQTEIDELRNEIEKRQHVLKEKMRVHSEMLKASNKMKMSLATFAKSSGIDESKLKELGIDLSQLSVTSPSRSSGTKSNKSNVQYFKNGQPLQLSGMSEVAYQCTKSCGGSSSDGRYKTNELLTKLELAGINKDESWAYKFKNDNVVLVIVENNWNHIQFSDTLTPDDISRIENTVKKYSSESEEQTA